MPDDNTSKTYSMKLIHGDLIDSAPVGHIPSAAVVQISESGASVGAEFPVQCSIYSTEVKDVGLVGTPQKTDKYGQIHIEFEASERHLSDPGWLDVVLAVEDIGKNNRTHIAIRRFLFKERELKILTSGSMTLAVGASSEKFVVEAIDTVAWPPRIEIDGRHIFETTFQPINKRLFQVDIDSGTTGLKLVADDIDSPGRWAFHVEGATAPGVATVTVRMDPDTYPATSDPKLATLQITVVPKA